MGIEQDLKSFWESYLPVLNFVGGLSSSVDKKNIERNIETQIAGLFLDLQVPTGWSVFKTFEKKWYDGLLVSDLTISNSDNTKSLIFKPKYYETKEGKVSLFEPDMMLEYDNAAIHFKPCILPEWSSPGANYRTKDYVINKSNIGILDCLKEEGKGSFVSHEWAKHMQEVIARPMFELKDNQIVSSNENLRKILVPKFGYNNEDPFKIFLDCHDGYKYLQSVMFNVENIGKGEIDKLLEHLNWK